MRPTLLICLLAVLLGSCASQSQRRTMPHPRERLQPARAILVRYPVDQPRVVEKEEDVPPRLDPAGRGLRAAALRELKNMPPPPPPGPPPGPPPPAGSCQWSPVGPTNIQGRVLDIAIDPTNRNRIFLATVGGVWRSTDFARRWERVSDDIFAGVFGAVAINQADPGEVFAGGGDANLISIFDAAGVGIWRSTTGGGPGAWSKTSPPELDDAVIYRLRVDPNAPHDVWAATSAGVWRGVHSGGGITWARPGNFDAWTSDLEIDGSVSPSLVYAGVQNATASFVRGVWKWNGSAWDAQNSGLDTTNSRTIKLAIAASSPNILFARIESSVNASLDGIYKTTNGGDIWSELAGADAEVGEAGTCSAGYMAPLDVDPSDANVVYSGCLAHVWRSTNGGTDWDPVDGGADPDWTFPVHVDHHVVAFDPLNPKIVYIGHDGGLDRSTDTSLPTWHWTDVSHGLTIWQNYSVGGQEGTRMLAAGGAQDTGNAFTFGNRSWYQQWDCDGSNSAFDATNPLIYSLGCFGIRIHVKTNPVPGTSNMGGVLITSPAVYPPLETDRDLSGRAIAATDPFGTCGGGVARTADNINFSTMTTAPGRFLTSLHIVADGTFTRFYAGFVTCAAETPQIWRTSNGGMDWDQPSTGLPASGRPLAIAADRVDGDHAYAAFASQIVMTTDGGASWTPVDGSGPTALPPSATRRGVVVDPADGNVLYVATDAGVFKGTISAGTGSWAPFSDGMPAGVDVRDIDADNKSSALLIGTWGFGVWRREIAPGKICAARMLLVRDNALDIGEEPSPSNVPNPDHPIPDPVRPGFFKPDDTPAGRAYWWESTDIRIDVPSVDPPMNQIASADHVEFETCAVTVSDCPAGTMMDSAPRRGKAARAYVQVNNRGNEPVTNVRVIALWAEIGATVPDLPVDFWTTTFPAGGGCGPLDSSTGWHLLGPCQTLAQVRPEMPEVARFDWSVPGDAPAHVCSLAIVEADSDPLDPNIRANNLRKVQEIVPQNRHITQRNLHVYDPQALTWMIVEPLVVFNPTKGPGIELVTSQRVRVALPQAIEGARRVELSNDEMRALREQKIETGFVYELERELALPIPAGRTWRIGLVASGSGRDRLSVLARRAGEVLGGSTYVVRAPRSR